MASKNTLCIRGRIIMVQESRFRLATENGQTFLFSVAGNASMDETDLMDLHRSNSRVVVEYEGEPNFESGIARSISVD